mgnify:CR=1 FL=1
MPFFINKNNLNFPKYSIFLDSTYASGDSCDELDVDIEDDNHSRSKLSISSADSGHAESGHALMQVDQEQNEEAMPVGRHHLEHLIKKGKSEINRLPAVRNYIYCFINSEPAA